MRSPAPTLVAAGGLAAAVGAAAGEPHQARAAASQAWPAFVLVAGLLLIGVVAEEDRFFAAAGGRLTRAASSGTAFFISASLLVTAVTAVLNLDTSVAFLTPVLAHATRDRGRPGDHLLYASVLLANAGSLFLPGSNLTNVIVLGHLQVTGAQFLARMWLPALATVIITTAVIGVTGRGQLREPGGEPAPPERPVLGVGLLAVAAATVLVLVLRSPALPVAGVGVFAVAMRSRSLDDLRLARDALGASVLVGLFGVAVALGTLGRAWDGPSTLLSHAGPWGNAATGAASSVLVNNLPAASLLSARPPVHPYSLLVGLNVGPNLFVTGSLAWILWLRSARRAGASPSAGRAARIGLVAAPLSIVAAVGLLIVVGHT